MGRFVICRGDLKSIISEVVGYKSGLVLSHTEIKSHLKYYKDLFEGNNDDLLMLRFEEVGEIVSQILFALGNIATADAHIPGAAIWSQMKKQPEKSAKYQRVTTQFFNKLDELIEKSEGTTGPLDLTPLVEDIAQQHKDPEVLDILLSIVSSMQQTLQASPLSPFRIVQWQDVKELAELFNSESLQTYYGTFFDQRFIDYLYRNFDSIDKMNWRKFEALVCEFFERQGFYVEIGEGRNDGSIDARVWPKKEDKTLPPLILIQCKRQKQKVEKVIVKALWADIVDESATSGLVVTTSALSPGAVDVCTARAYPIEQANRGTLKQWITEMRSPHTDISAE